MVGKKDLDRPNTYFHRYSAPFLSTTTISYESSCAVLLCPTMDLRRDGIHSLDIILLNGNILELLCHLCTSCSYLRYLVAMPQLFDNCLIEDNLHQSLTGQTVLIDAILLSNITF